jgi:hypothetical protein
VRTNIECGAVMVIKVAPNTQQMIAREEGATKVSSRQRERRLDKPLQAVTQHSDKML